MYKNRQAWTKYYPLLQRSVGELRFIEELDVIGYHDLYKEYDTDLKIKVFKKTDWYKEKENELKELREEQRTSTFYIKDSESFDDLTYSLDHNGFLVEIGTNEFNHSSFGRPYKTSGINSYSAIYFKYIPTLKNKYTIPYAKWVKGIVKEYALIKTSEETGLEIEENKERVTIYFLLKPIRIEKIKFSFMAAVNKTQVATYNQNSGYLTSDFLRIIVANDDTGKIYYDKIIHK
ncbi:MAG: hypothetical protein LCH54_11180 [Bacteroidetes bacterium]|nr:hypothetical protein [Bacteroidota bacterium]